MQQLQQKKQVQKLIKILLNNIMQTPIINYKSFTAFLVLIFCTTFAFAQPAKDTTKRPAIDITSSYKPVLRNAVKINFSASNLNADTSKPNLVYQVPAQNLFIRISP